MYLPTFPSTFNVAIVRLFNSQKMLLYFFHSFSTVLFTYVQIKPKQQGQIPCLKPMYSLPEQQF